MIDRQPTLTGERVALRPLRGDDWDALFAIAADPAIWAVHPAHDRWQEPVFRRFFDDALASSGALTIVDRATGVVIGSSRYGEYDADRDRIEIGWTFLARAHWGGAVNGEVKRLMIDHAFADVPRVVFWVGEDNVRSRRALEKIGATPTDETEDRSMATGIVRHLVYAIAR
ncbi:GNAT family N-acetyltransferase [Sphingomonas sp.]|uniref:GNAT family N-acetyltransferase n=1 Tax=Sphingomonas sp. TaxID=28214 RepID=UPI003AFF863B